MYGFISDRFISGCRYVMGLRIRLWLCGRLSVQIVDTVLVVFDLTVYILSQAVILSSFADCWCLNRVVNIVLMLFFKRFFGVYEIKFLCVFCVLYREGEIEKKILVCFWNVLKCEKYCTHISTCWVRRLVRVSVMSGHAILIPLQDVLQPEYWSLVWMCEQNFLRVIFLWYFALSVGLK